MATAQAPKGVTAARPKAKDNKGDKDKKPAIQTPSQFGSHASMTNEEQTGKIAAAKQDAADPWVILTDERGLYATRKSRLDNHLTDPNRSPALEPRERRVKELTAS